MPIHFIVSITLPLSHATGRDPTRAGPSSRFSGHDSKHRRHTDPADDQRRFMYPVRIRTVNWRRDRCDKSDNANMHANQIHRAILAACTVRLQQHLLLATAGGDGDDMSGRRA